MENSTFLMAVCDGSFVNSEGKTFATHRLLLRRESSKGVSYELEKYDAKKITSDELAACSGFSVNPLYDKYGRIVSL